MLIVCAGVAGNSGIIRKYCITLADGMFHKTNYRSCAFQQHSCVDNAENTVKFLRVDTPK